jgi:predicted AAA+ superfamily ATPase
MEIEILINQNPWWKNENEIEYDEDIRKWREGKRNWIPSTINEIDLKPFSLNFIFGPRQVGKTTLLKLLIRKLLLEDKVEKERIFYFRCDKLEDYKELDEVLKTYFEFRKSKNITSSFIFLDEITFPREGYRTIKYYIDSGEFKNDVLILCGSISMELKREVETFSGRRGYGKDIILLPLSFKEFIKVFDFSLYEKIPRIENLEKDEIFKKAYEIFPYFNEIQDLFFKYLKIGGFPVAVRNEEINQEVKDVYWIWIKSDLAKINRSDETFRRVAKAVLEKTPSPISLNSIAKEFEIGTHKTVFEYLDVMEKMFITKVLYYLDLNKVASNFKKNRKVCFTDPLFFYLFSDVCLSKVPDESIIVENVVISHLSRRFEVFYWRNKREIDVIAKHKKLIGFEVKWKEKVEDFSKIKIGKLEDVVCLTKNILNKEKNLLPVSLFLALI